MTAVSTSLMARIQRIHRQRRIARVILRVLRLDEVEVLPVGEYAVAFGYVELSNDLRAVLAAARKAATQTDVQASLDLLAAIERFDELYPELPR